MCICCPQISNCNLWATSTCWLNPVHIITKHCNCTLHLCWRQRCSILLAWVPPLAHLRVDSIFCEHSTVNNKIRCIASVVEGARALSTARDICWVDIVKCRGAGAITLAAPHCWVRYLSQIHKRNCGSRRVHPEQEAHSHRLSSDQADRRVDLLTAQHLACTCLQVLPRSSQQTQSPSYAPRAWRERRS